MPSSATIKNRRVSRCTKKDNMRIDRATVAAALPAAPKPREGGWAALCTGTAAPSVALRTAKRLQRCNAHVIITRMPLAAASDYTKFFVSFVSFVVNFTGFNHV